MCNEKNTSDEDQLKLENPTKYYLKNFKNHEIMDELKWEDPYLYDTIIRLHYIKQMQNPDNIYMCPECRGNIITDESGEEYCKNCGLVTRTHYPYVAGQRFIVDYGLK